MFRNWFGLTLTLYAGVLPSHGEVENDLTLGIEAVTGYRSAYIQRGFKLADGILDFQLETEVALGGDRYLGLAGWHAAESGDDFSETAFALDLRQEFDALRFIASVEYHTYAESLFEDGLDLGFSATWFPHENWDLGAEVHYDTGAEGLYAAAEAGWSQPVNKSLFLAIESGISITSDYYERSGANDIYGRLSLTYNVNSFLSLTPFTGVSIGLDDEADTEAYGGFWFAVSF